MDFVRFLIPEDLAICMVFKIFAEPGFKIFEYQRNLSILSSFCALLFLSCIVIPSLFVLN